MSNDTLKDKARLLLARRVSPPGIAYYLRQRWQRHLFFLGAYVGISTALWAAQQHTLAIAIGGYFVGRTVRDFQWWHSLSCEWHSTAELLDWERITQIADDHTA